MAAKRFYVYKFAQDGVTLYVGKGSGRRFAAQCRRFGFVGEIVRYCRSERDAYAQEVRLIKQLNPTLNQNSGGGGSWSARRTIRRPKWLIEMEKVGTRVYAARELLKLDLRGHLTGDQIDRIRLVASTA